MQINVAKKQQQLVFYEKLLFAISLSVDFCKDYKKYTIRINVCVPCISCLNVFYNDGVDSDVKYRRVRGEALWLARGRLGVP